MHKNNNNGNARVKKARTIIMLTMEITCQGSWTTFELIKFFYA